MAADARRVGEQAVDRYQRRDLRSKTWFMRDSALLDALCIAGIFADPVKTAASAESPSRIIYLGSSWNRVGDFGAEGLTKLCISRVFCITAGLGFGINSGWHEQRSAGGDFGIRIGSPGFDRNRQCTAFLVIRKHA